MAISFDNPVATHKLTYKPLGKIFLLCVVGDNYRLKNSNDEDGWDSNVYSNVAYYITSTDWQLAAINKFKGNV